jgi:hypothetical protein
MSFLEYLAGMGRLVRAKACSDHVRNRGARRSRRELRRGLGAGYYAMRPGAGEGLGAGLPLSTTQRYIDVNDDMMRAAVELMT